MATSALRLAIVQSEWTQRALCEQVGLHETTLSRLVRGRSCASVGTRRALAFRLGCREEDLFDRTGRPLVVAVR